MVFKTFTKEHVVSPVGTGYVKYVAEQLDIPFVAIGGVKEANMKEVLSAGAECISMVTEITEANDIGKKIKSIYRCLQEGA